MRFSFSYDHSIFWIYRFQTKTRQPPFRLHLIAFSHRGTERKTRRKGDKGTRRREEGEMQGQGDLNSPSPCPPLSLSPCLLVPPLSSYLCVCGASVAASWKRPVCVKLA